MKYFGTIIICMACFLQAFAQTNVYKTINSSQLPYGNVYSFWDDQTVYSKTYHVNIGHPEASDENPGTDQQPFKTIQKAAEILKPGEKVIIHSGVYRESVYPSRGGTDKSHMITYEAARGEKVVLKGSVELDKQKWQPSIGWNTGEAEFYPDKNIKNSNLVWQYDLKDIQFNGYNPFGMLNLMHDREWLNFRKVKMKAHFKRRGMVFLNGKPIKQVEKVIDLKKEKTGAFWPEHNGLRLHVRFPDGTEPADFDVEITTKEQLFAPQKYGLGYIKISGLSFMHSGNGFPVPQRGMVSASRGHHFIIENCKIIWANSLGIDLGNEMWHTEIEEELGHHIFRQNEILNCGIAGLEGMRGENYLIEDNLFQNIGWQDAEHGFESGAIKLHMSKGTLIRRNVFRDVVYAPGIWLDYMASQNCRITQNVFTNITTARGCIYIEVSRRQIRIDHNFFHNTHSQYWISGDYGAGGNALYTDGSDSIIFDHNMALNIENTGYGSYANAARIVKGRGGTERHQKILNNIFIDCGKHAIELPNKYNHADYNIFSKMGSGYLTLKNPEPQLLLDLNAWQDYLNWGENSNYIKKIEVSFDDKNLELTIDGEDGMNEAGPFNGYSFKEKNIDSRNK